MLVTPCPSGMPLCRKGPATRTRGALAKKPKPRPSLLHAHLSHVLSPRPRPILAGNVPGPHLAPVGARRLVRRIMMLGRRRGLSESRERRKRHCGAEADCGDGLEHSASSQVKRASCRGTGRAGQLGRGEGGGGLRAPSGVDQTLDLAPALDPQTSTPIIFRPRIAFPADEASRACLNSSFLIRLLRYAKDPEGCSRRRRTASS